MRARVLRFVRVARSMLGAFRILAVVVLVSRALAVIFILGRLVRIQARGRTMQEESPEECGGVGGGRFKLGRPGGGTGGGGGRRRPGAGGRGPDSEFARRDIEHAG